MQIHIVKQGEDVYSIAYEYKMAKWEDLYHHPLNKRLRETRQDPGLLYPGDVVYIPDLETIKYKLATNQKHHIVLPTKITKLVLRLLNEQGAPLQCKKYELSAGGKVVFGTTDGDGKLEEKIPVSINHATLKVWPNDDQQDFWIYQLGLGQLDPTEEISGVQGRLRNLGQASGPLDGQFGPVTHTALQQFQQLASIAAAGAVDADTKKKLNE